MEMLKLVYLEWLSAEREKHVWEDLYSHSWDEIIGRVYLLKAHSAIEEECYEDALPDFEQALVLLANDNIRKDFYYGALVDKALVQCFLGQYGTVLTVLDEALTALDDPFYEEDQRGIKRNRAAALVLTGAFSEALTALEQELHENPDDTSLRFTMATCLLHLERYDEAIAAYEQVAKEEPLPDESGLEAARQRRQPDWDDL